MLHEIHPRFCSSQRVWPVYRLMCSSPGASLGAGGAEAPRAAEPGLPVVEGGERDGAGGAVRSPAWLGRGLLPLAKCWPRCPGVSGRERPVRARQGGERARHTPCLGQVGVAHGVETPSCPEPARAWQGRGCCRRPAGPAPALSPPWEEQAGGTTAAVVAPALCRLSPPGSEAAGRARWSQRCSEGKEGLRGAEVCEEGQCQRGGWVDAGGEAQTRSLPRGAAPGSCPASRKSDSPERDWPWTVCCCLARCPRVPR